MGTRVGSGTKVRMLVRLELSRDDAESLLAEAITAERQLDGYVTELVVAHLHRPSAGPLTGGTTRKAR